MVPAAAGLFSSAGLLDADEAVHLVLACPGPMATLAPETVIAAFEGLNLEARASLRAGMSVATTRRADLRYRGQSTALTVDLPPGPIDRRSLRALERAFVSEHHRTYGYAPPGEAIEMVNVRLGATAERSEGPRPLVGLTGGRLATATGAAVSSRAAWFGDRQGWVDTPLLARSDLLDGRDGPLIVEEYDATTVVPPDCSATLDNWGNIVIDIHDEG